jgi:hypothetical protein
MMPNKSMKRPSEKLEIPAHWKTSENSGTKYVIIGTPDRSQPKKEMSEETPEAREKLLNALKPRDRDLIERIMDQHPGLTAAEAIEHTDAFGGLSLSGTGVREMLGKSE